MFVNQTGLKETLNVL